MRYYKVIDASLNIYIFFQAWTDCLVEIILRRTRWISDRTLDKKKKISTSRVCVALKPTWNCCTLTNVKFRSAISKVSPFLNIASECYECEKWQKFILHSYWFHERITIRSCDNFPTHNLAQRRAVICAVSSEIKETHWQKFKCFFKITFICYQHYSCYVTNNFCMLVKQTE